MTEFRRPLVELTDKGLFCSAGGFHIDPRRGVDVAIVTHAHSDHARRGSRLYICEKSGEGLLRSRLGKSIQVRALEYGEPLRLGEVTISLHSAGHILGSAQVRVECGTEVWVASGDYKRDPDPSCEPFEVVKCDTFITEATFGTPKYRWPKSARHGEEIHAWWSAHAEQGRNAIVFGYSLGKAQRILAELHPFMRRPVLVHEAIIELTQCYRAQGRLLAETRSLAEVIQESETMKGELILAPPSIFDEAWSSRLGDYVTAFASGWMQTGGWGRGDYDHGFVMSDHADWNDLLLTIRECGASRVFVQHRNGVLVRHLRSLGVEAHPEEALLPENYLRIPERTLSLFPEVAT